jgi:hypothetical protein
MVLLWTSDQLDAENSDNTRHLQETDIHAPAGFEPAVPAVDRPLGSARTELTLSNYWYSSKLFFLINVHIDSDTGDRGCTTF